MHPPSPPARAGALYATLGAVLVLSLLAAIATQATPVDAIRFMVRMTARCSGVLFALAFAAGALHARWPSVATQWLLDHRRHLGLAFVASHGAHAVALATLWSVAPETFRSLVNPVMWVLGGLGYGFIVLMALGSFPMTSSWLARRAWQRVLWLGSWYLWGGLLQGFAKASVQHRIDVVLVALLVGVAVLRWWPAMRGAAVSRA